MCSLTIGIMVLDETTQATLREREIQVQLFFEFRICFLI